MENPLQMYISKKNRAKIKNKFGGRCAYSGTILEDDWEVDHINPLIRCPVTKKPMFPDKHTVDNMVPCQKEINRYKGNLELDTFRNWYLAKMHERYLPKNPKTEESKRKKARMLKIRAYFGITEETPFSGVFYFETLNKKER